MSSSTFAGNSGDGITGLCPAPPPPPPPPVPGQVPAVRINTVEAPAVKRPQINNGAYEPPAAIQNAMLTKDKKPFTYTPGMGGKLDLSQIRSPRMARRVAKNANDEGIEGPPKSALEPKPTQAPNAGANLFIQPQVAVPVFPTNIPPPPSVRTPPTPPVNRTPSNVSDMHAEPVKNVTKAETKVTPIIVTSVQSSPSESPSTPTQITLTKAPTPWLQNKNKPQEELPEWAKRSGANKQSSSPDSPTSPPVYTQIQQTQQQPQWQQTQEKQQPVQSVQQRQQPQQYQYQQQQQPQLYQQQKRPFPNTATQPTSPQANQQERVIPIRIEDRPSVFDVKPEGGHHQFKQSPSSHHQQRWGQSPVQNQVQMQHVVSPLPQQTTGGSYIVPIMMEGSDNRPASVSNNSYAQPTARNNVIENQTTKVIPQRGPPVQQGEPGPVQSRSFRVLQKITDTDAQIDVDPEQMRKLQLTEDDRMLMNKFKEQVDSDSFLHQEEDPRYRGAAIPSRAFRFLQTMTDSGETPVPSTTPRVPTAINKKQNRNSKSFEETQANLPPSEQQVQEPKKYMGSAIPSRSFRILQAMTAPESVATQENRQADYTCQTENNAPGNQQGVYFPPCPPPFWNPETGWWGYCPLPYAGVSDTNNQQLDTYPYQNDGTAYICYPIYNQNYPNYPECNLTNGEQNFYANMYPQYVYDPAQNNQNIRNDSFAQINSNDTLCSNDQVPDILNNRLQEVGNKITNDTNDLNVTSQWDRSNHVSRAGSSNSNKDSDCTTAMNITDEEEIPENVVTPGTAGSIHDSTDKKPAAVTGLNVPVPNYTYMDTSDSNDSTDSESQSDNESISESSKSNASNNKNAACDNTSSDSDDSESYLAYSTGLNPEGRQEEDAERNTSITHSSKESSDDIQENDSFSEKVNSTDCELDMEDKMENDTQSNPKKLQDEIIPHKLSVIYEDAEHAGSESPRSQSSKDFRRQNETDFEATDETETPTVSVSLPLRFKFSVSENNEDVTTVIVGDSTIKSEPSHNKTESRSSQAQESCSKEKDKEDSESYQVNNETTVDFTLKRQTSESKRKVKSYINEKVREEVIESKTEKNEKIETPHVNFTLRKNRSRINKINEETIETEFTIKSKKISTRIEEIKSEESLKECSVTTNTLIGVTEKSKETVERHVINNEDITFDTSVDDTMNYSATVKVDQNTFETHDINKNVVKPEVVVSECTWTEESSKISSDNLLDTIADSEIESSQTFGESNLDYSTKQRTEDDRNTDADEKLGKEPKHLLSVQNSREETDDEDSGVTSDMSRIISEVDTDSECTSSKNIKKYQRTQTHSRLFRLLNDDSILPKHAERCADITSRREYLSLPLKTNNFNYDDNYCSNYSSGVTSPEYSPICEQSWQRLHDAENEKVRTEQNGDAFRYGSQILSHQERVSCKEDPYYQAWKAPKAPAPSDHDVVPSLAFKVLECKKPLWAYKVNVLCPRIKSTKNVPQTLQGNKTTDSSAPPIPTSYVNPKTEHC